MRRRIFAVALFAALPHHLMHSHVYSSRSEFTPTVKFPPHTLRYERIFRPEVSRDAPLPAPVPPPPPKPTPTVSSSLGTFVATCYDSGWITRTGTHPAWGTIAVDPRVIPLGTRLYVRGYGYGTALDTGGAIIGHHIDLFMDPGSCAHWGKRYVSVNLG